MIGLTKRLFILLFFLFLVLLSGFTEDNGKVPATANGETLKKPTLVILPLISKDISVYIPKVVDKLLEAKLEKINTYAILPKEDVDNFLEKQGIVLKTEPQLDYLKKYSDLLDVDQIMYGIIRSENKEYKLVTRIYDVKKQKIILKDTETSANIRQLDSAADNLTRKIIKRLFPPAVVKKAEKELNKDADTKKEAQVKKNLADFAALAEKNPEKALSLVAKPARKALENSVKEKVKKEVVHEEIQNLFEKEKAEKAREKKRKWQLWTTFGLNTLGQLGNITGSLAEYERINSLLYWNKYMNNQFQDDPYRTYKQSVYDFGSFVSQKYLFSGAGNIAVGIGMNYMLGDTFTFSPVGKYLFSVFYGLNTLGNAISTLTTQLQFFSFHKYLVYADASADFTSKYSAYRDSLIWPEIARYTTYGLWGLGYTGMIVSALLPGEKSSMIVSEKARRLLSWGSGLTGIAAIISGMALNYYGLAEESWITEKSPSGSIGDSLTKQYSLTADILTYTSYGLLLAGGTMSVIGLLMRGDASPPKSTKENTVSFDVVPSAEGTSMVVTLGVD